MKRAMIFTTLASGILTAAAFDLLFVCIQRYNRPMLLRQIGRSASPAKK